MRKAYKYILVTLIIILLGAAAVSLYFYGRIESDYNDAYIRGSQNLKYHFSVIINKSSSLYWQEFISGAQQAAGEYGVALEYHGINPIDYTDEAGQFIKIAVAAGNDGIVINTLDEETYVNDIMYAADKDIPVVVTGITAQKFQISYYVGTNAYEYGLNAAKLAVESAGDDPRIALIVDDEVSIGDINDPEELNQSMDMQIIGFLEGVRLNPGAEILVIKKTSNAVIGAEDVVQYIFDNYPDVNSIFCMTPEDTVAAAQAVIDRNKVGGVVVTGTDLSLTPPVLKYIDKHIIYGYINRNPREAGYKSVETLYRVVSGEFQPTYVDIDLDIVTSQNIDELLSEVHDD